MPDIKTNISIPPRRRTATLEVDLTDGRTVRASVNKNEVKLSLKHKGGYGTTDSISIPRNEEDLLAVEALIRAAHKEMLEQDAFIEAEGAAA